MQIRWEVFCAKLLTDKQTNSDENTTSLAEVDETRFHDINADSQFGVNWFITLLCGHMTTLAISCLHLQPAPSQSNNDVRPNPSPLSLALLRCRAIDCEIDCLGHRLWNLPFFCYNFNKLTYLLLTCCSPLSTILDHFQCSQVLYNKPDIV